MKIREAAVGVALVGALAACTPADHSPDKASASANQLHFLPEARDSDFFGNINCDQYPTSEEEVFFERVEAGDRNARIFTLGDSEQNADMPYPDPSTVHFLAGITWRVLKGKTVEFVTSADPAVQKVDLGVKSISGDIPVNDNFKLHYFSEIIRGVVGVELDCVPIMHIPGPSPQTQV